MIARDIVCSDDFVDMSYIAQALYYQMLINADDDGFISNHKQITRSIGASEETVNELIDNQFIIRFETGIIVIKHWKAQNRVAKDRYKSTKFIAEKELLTINEQNEYQIK